MLVTYVRSSSYNNYSYCEQQYYMTYVLGHQSKSGKKADMGTMAHKAMEVLACLKKDMQDRPKARILKVDDDAIGEFKCNKNELFTDDLVNSLIDIAIDSYEAKSDHSFSKKDRKDINETVWTFLTHNDGQFDPRNRDIYYPEPHFDIPIDEPWAKFTYEKDGEMVEGQVAIKGTIDLVTKIDDETIEVVDWKTGRRLDWATGEVKDYKKLENDAQLLLYYYAMSKMYPDFPYRIMSIFFYKDADGNKDPQPYSLCFDESDQDRFLEMLRKRVEEIKANVMPQRLDPTMKHWKCKYLCHFAKNNWPGTDTPMCKYVADQLQENGMEETTKNCTRPGFDIAYYEAPG